MTAATLNNRLSRLEQGTAPETIWIRMQPADATTEQAQARWLGEHPDRKADLQRARVRFVQRVIVDVTGGREAPAQ
jgi:hypothetical protein